MMKKSLVVFGATGIQGGSVIKAVLSDPRLQEKYMIKAVSRNPSGDAATALAKRDVEVTKGDMNDPDSLAAAVQGADVVFAVTQFFETASSDGEVQQGLNIVNALENTRAHLIFSTFPIADIILANPEEYNDLQQWKSKVIIEKAALETLGSHRCSFVCCGMYMESFKTLFTPQKTSHGEYVLQAPFPTSTEMPLLSADRDTGLFVIPILLSPASYAGKYLYAATESPAFTDIARILSEVTGKQVIARESSERSFWDEQMPPQMRPLEPVMNGMLRFIREHGLFGKNEKEGISWTLQRVEQKPQNWREFVEEQVAWF